MSEGLVGGEGFAVDASLIKADASRARGVSGAEIAYCDFDPERSTRAVREYLAALDDNAPPETAPKSVSLTDPMARWTAAGGPAFFAYLCRSSPPTTSLNCCSVQSAVGCAVTFTCARRRVPCSMTTNTYSVRNVAVTATKKSHARMPFA
jgi:hypothetical protein